MAQRAKYIDLSRTFLPIDPNTLPETMHDTAGEDKPEQRIPVVPYEGWNFMPTGQGWRSYFGLTGALGIDALAVPARCRDIFVYQREDLVNLLVALCDDGIWTKQGESAGAWTHAITLVDPNTGTLLEWSRCIIENVLYIYQQANPKVYTYEAPAYTWVENVPTTLNMAGQLGIFKAGARLGFWDSDDAIGFSSATDRFNVTPDIGTQANITKIVSLVGKIINVLQHGDGFVIYGTKSIVGVQKDFTNAFLWNASQITTAAGIAHRNQACLGAPDTTHYAWTSNSLMRIENFKAEVVIPELYDYLKEGQDPVHLKMLEGRYLFIQLANEDYVDGIITFYTETIGGATVSLSDARAAITTMPDPITIDVLTASQQSALYPSLQQYQGHIAVMTEEGDCAGPGFCLGKDYGTYTDHFLLPVSGSVAASLAELAGNKLKSPVFNAIPYTLGGNTRYTVAGVNPIMAVTIGAGAPDYEYGAVTGLTATTQANDNDFFDKCRTIWDSYNIAAENHIAAMEANMSVYGPDGAREWTSSGDGIGITIFYDFEYEMGKVDYTYYFIARPRKLWSRATPPTVEAPAGVFTSLFLTVVADIAYCDGTYKYVSYSHPTVFFRYLADGSTVASPNSPPAYSEAPVLADGLCDLGRGARAKPTVMGMGSVGSLVYSNLTMTINGVPFTSTAYPAESFTYPAASFLMQKGSTSPYYMKWPGAFVYDTHYKRWGKMKNDYHQLLDFSPINSTSIGTIPYTHFGVNGALLDSAGAIKVFDTNPTDSYLKFGKMGNFRFGFTTLESVRADFRRNCTGQLETESSLDGRSVEVGLTKTYNYTDVRQVFQGIDSAGSWHNLALKGEFDLTYLEYRAWTSSRR